MTRTGRWRAPLLVIAIALIAACAAQAPESAAVAVAGRARVVDGDTLEIRGQNVRLAGVDAPELRQTCARSGRKWPCGRAAARALARKIEGQTVVCTWRETDRWNRPLASCHTGETDLSAWLAERGWALAFRRYSSTYVIAESKARAAGRGLWSGSFTAPWDYRKATGRTANASGRALALATVSVAYPHVAADTLGDAGRDGRRALMRRLPLA